ncbi:hypothetical protein Tco_0668791 [Tanacetum coccineum]
MTVSLRAIEGGDHAGHEGHSYGYWRPPQIETFIALVLLDKEHLCTKYDKLRIEFNKSESDLDNYKRGLASVEEQLVFYKKNEGMLCDQIIVPKSDASFNEAEIIALKCFKEPEFEGYGVKVDKCVSEKSSKEIKKTPCALIIKDWVSRFEEQDEVEIKCLKRKQLVHNVKKNEFVKA